MCEHPSTGNTDTPYNSHRCCSLAGCEAVFHTFARPFQGTIAQTKPPSRAEAEQSRLSPCKGPSGLAGAVFPFLGGLDSMPRAHNRRCTTPGQRRLPTVSARRRQRRREGRACKVDAFRGPSGSFYTLEKLGSSLSSSPTDCSCCCRCSDLADHVARGDLGAARPVAASSRCLPVLGTAGTLRTEVPVAPQPGAGASSPSPHPQCIPLGNSLPL